METIKSCLSKYQITLKQKHEEAKTNHKKDSCTHSVNTSLVWLLQAQSWKLKERRHSRTVEMPETFCTLSMFVDVCAWLVWFSVCSESMSGSVFIEGLNYKALQIFWKWMTENGIFKGGSLENGVDRKKKTIN